MLRDAGDSLTWNSLLVSWFLGSLVLVFLVSWFLGFLVSWLLGFLFCWFLGFVVSACLGFVFQSLLFKQFLGVKDYGFLGFKVSWFFGFTDYEFLRFKFQSFLVSNILVSKNDRYSFWNHPRTIHFGNMYRTITRFLGNALFGASLINKRVQEPNQMEFVGWRNFELPNYFIIN